MPQHQNRQIEEREKMEKKNYMPKNKVMMLQEFLSKQGADHKDEKFCHI